MSRARDLGDVGSKANFLDNVSTDLGDFSGQSIPHIIPDVLYPAVEGKDLAGVAFSGSYVYGTAHTDGRKYYYTDIKGSKPIKDPRIGGHFGSQRHKFKSKQLLEQETVTNGSNVYSVDGREWCRLVGTGWTQTYSNYSTGGIQNDLCNDSTTEYVEVVAYCNALNFISYTASTYGKAKLISIDGSADTTTQEGFASVSTPLHSRYVDAGSVIPLKTATLSLGIHTFRIGFVNNVVFDGIELIAQDTSSTANRSKIQIPSQNVVSYGKKFTVSAEGSSGHHYDPFNGFTSGSSVSSYVDTATSLGCDNWKYGSTYYRPYNGGRVVKWVDSSGVIKTSVTLMPPNAKSIADSSSLTNATAKANASASNDTFYPTFEAHTTDVNEDQLHEVAKAFHWREFGNGSANGGTGATNYADASMIQASNDNIAYVMDDGLSSLSANSWQAHISGTHNGALLAGAQTPCYITFIGTGISVNFSTDTTGADTRYTIAQNLPYGTHVLRLLYHTGGSNDIFIDGVQVEASGADAIIRIKNDITFHQPKRPPIPEDACVLADYMLMADFVPQTSAGIDKISKGTRKVAISRDVFFTGEAMSMLQSLETDSGWIFYLNSNGTNASTKLRIPSFGTNFVKRGFHDRSTLFIGDSSQSSNQTASTGSGAHGDTHRLTANQDLGVYNFGSNPNNGANGITSSFEIATPIHTSSHYQSFETPFLHELVGGDRNMEQTNLVCSPDGKTWDQITRDMSYLASDIVLSATNNTATTWATVIVLDEWRGQPLHGGTQREKECFNKDSWAIAYDRMICLKEGTYEMFTVGAFDGHQDIYVNGISAQLAPNASHTGIKLIRHMKRGDYIQPTGDFGESGDVRYSHFYIKKIN